MSPLLLSLFPGVDLLGHAFELEWPDACVVRGPDLIYGSLSDIRTFHPPPGVFDGQVKMSRYSLADACELQGLPRDFLDDAPFTAQGKLKAVANGVPMPMGRAVAKAVRCAMGAI